MRYVDPDSIPLGIGLWSDALFLAVEQGIPFNIFRRNANSHILIILQPTPLKWYFSGSALLPNFTFQEAPDA